MLKFFVAYLPKTDFFVAINFKAELNTKNKKKERNIKGTSVDHFVGRGALLLSQNLYHKEIWSTIFFQHVKHRSKMDPYLQRLPPQLAKLSSKFKASHCSGHRKEQEIWKKMKDYTTSFLSCE